MTDFKFSFLTSNIASTLPLFNDYMVGTTQAPHFPKDSSQDVLIAKKGNRRKILNFLFSISSR